MRYVSQDCAQSNWEDWKRIGERERETGTGKGRAFLTENAALHSKVAEQAQQAGSHDCKTLFQEIHSAHESCCMQGRIAEQAQHRLSGLENWPITHTQEAYLDKFQKQRDNLVYLTADSPNELSELDPTKRYIIGGIVDRNRHKNICFRKAEAQVISDTVASYTIRSAAGEARPVA